MSERIIDSETGEIVSDGAIVKADWYGNLVDDCKAIITEGTFNSRWALVEMYWHLGERINTDNDMTRELIYGKKIVSDLSQSLSMSTRNVWRAVQFNRKYPDIDTLPEGKNITWNKIVTKYLPESKEIVEPEPTISGAENIASYWEVESGQVWRCGEHLVICGDCNDPDILAKAMQFGKPDVLLNDPPYGMVLDTDYSKLPSTKPEGNKAYAPVRGDDKQFEYNNLGLDCIEEFWFGADYYRRSIPDGGSWLVWDKRVDEKFDAMFGSAFELIWSKNKHKREIIRCNNTLFSGEAEAKNKLHPTTKPTKVIDWILSRYSVQGQLVMDMYAGSGTTLIVCNNLKRRNVSVEIEPMYVGVILQRFYDATGVKPELEA